MKVSNFWCLLFVLYYEELIFPGPVVTNCSTVEDDRGRTGDVTFSYKRKVLVQRFPVSFTCRILQSFCGSTVEIFM